MFLRELGDPERHGSCASCGGSKPDRVPTHPLAAGRRLEAAPGSVRPLRPRVIWELPRFLTSLIRMSRDQRGRCALWVHQEEVAVAPRCNGPAAVARLDAEWLGRRQLVWHVGSESGMPSRSEVAALGLHVARRLPGVPAGELGEAGGPFGPAVLAQRLSGRGDVTVRQGREKLVKPGAPGQRGAGAAQP